MPISRVRSETGNGIVGGPPVWSVHDLLAFRDYRYLFRTIMQRESFREINRRRREENAAENLYAWARRAGVPNPKKTAEREARRIHGNAVVATQGQADGPDAVDNSAATDGTDDREVPHRLDDRTKEQLYQRAQELEIEGRSQMTKEELVDAIRAQN